MQCRWVSPLVPPPAFSCNGGYIQLGIIMRVFIRCFSHGIYLHENPYALLVITGGCRHALLLGEPSGHSCKCLRYRQWFSRITNRYCILIFYLSTIECQSGTARDKRHIRKIRTGERNELGDQLVEFCSRNDFQIMNTLFTLHAHMEIA